MAPRTDFPPVRACLFDMDGLILNTEDLYTLCVNTILERYGRPRLPWSIKAKLQGRPGPASAVIFREWAQLPLSQDEFLAECSALQQQLFPSAKPLPGVERLLADLDRTRHWDLKKGGEAGGEPHPVHLALATSSTAVNFGRKTGHLQDLFSVFSGPRRVLGDDPRIPAGRGKPLPDIYLLALRTVNDSLPAGEPPVTPEECLVFEDSVPGVEAGRRAGMRVVWCPHPGLRDEYRGREKEVLAGRTFEAGDVDVHQVGELDDGWGDQYDTLEGFPYAKYGIVVPPAEVDKDPRV